MRFMRPRASESHRWDLLHRLSPECWAAVILLWAAFYFAAHALIAITRDPASTDVVRVVATPQATVAPTTVPPAPSQAAPPGPETGTGPPRVTVQAPASTTSTACRASWYGDESGSVTASGARNDPTALHAAHRTLPFGTRIAVTYAGHTVVVTVDDRGPAARTGRQLDLSRAAFQRLAPLGVGVIDARCEVIP